MEITVGCYESGFPMIRGTFGDFCEGLMKEGIGTRNCSTGKTLIHFAIGDTESRFFSLFVV